jgi:uncharacterized protein YcgL (UPF0745 family)
MKDLQQAINERMNEIVQNERALNADKDFEVVRDEITYNFTSGKWVLILLLQSKKDLDVIKHYKTVTL